MENLRLLSSISQRALPYVKRRSFIVDACFFIFAVLLGRVCVLGAIYPFALAFMAGADAANKNVYFPFAGAIVGSLITGQASHASLFCAVFYIAARLLYPFATKKLNRADKLLCFGAACAITLPLFYMSSWIDFATGVSGAFFALMLAISFQNALRALGGIELRQRLHEEEQIAICLLIGSLALALSDVSVYSFSLGVVVAVWAAMFIAFSKGLSAVAASVALGAMLLLGGKAGPLFLADMALCALAAVVLRGAGVWGAAAGFLICCAVTDVYLGGQQIGLINAVPAAAALVMIPKRGQLYLRSLVDSGAKEERTARAILKRIQNSAAEEITRAVNTVEDVAELFPESADWVHDSTKESADMQRAALHICDDCTYRGSCWRETEKAMRVVENMLTAHSQGIRPRASKPLRSDCAHLASIAAAAAQARDSYREKCMQAYHAASQQAFVNRQLKGVGHVMRKLSIDIKDGEWPDDQAAQILQRRLEREGIAVKGLMLRQKRGSVLLEIRLARENHRQAFMEDAVSRAYERQMRLLSTRDTPRGLIMEFEPAQRLTAVSGTYTQPKRGSSLSGDSSGSVSLPNGQMLYVLSDGMGSGTAAHDQSLAAVNMLIKLYSVGYERDVALECVNRVLMKKGTSDMYATLDALHIDLKTGGAEFIKCGASPSFVLREGQVHTIYAEALPAGVLPEAMPAVHAAALKQNDSVIMLTDGALDALGEDAKHEILVNVGGANTCEDAARDLLQSAAARGPKDDMTVMVVRME